MNKLTIRILTAKSRLLRHQKAQLPSHRLPPRKAKGMTVLRSMSQKIGPSSERSTIRARAIASWKSFSCLRQTLTASLRDPPSKKKAAAYSNLQLSSFSLSMNRAYQAVAFRVKHRHFSVLLFSTVIQKSRWKETSTSAFAHDAKLLFSTTHEQAYICLGQSKAASMQWDRGIRRLDTGYGRYPPFGFSAALSMRIT